MAWHPAITSRQRQTTKAQQHTEMATRDRRLLVATALVSSAAAVAIVVARRRRAAATAAAASAAAAAEASARRAAAALAAGVEQPAASAPVDAVAKAKAHVKFGNALARAGQPEKALEQFRKARELNPRNHAAHHNSGGICQRLQRFEEAIGHYEAALAVKPTLVEAASNLAVAQLNAKQPRAAIATCRRAIELQAGAGRGMNLEASHHLNVALRLVGEREAAVEETWASIAKLVAATGAPAAAAAVRPTPIAFASAPPAQALSEGGSAPLSVVCVKWGSKYGAEYVNKLSRAVRRALGTEGVRAFVCFTEDADGLDDDVETRPLPSRPQWEGWWFKAHLFSSAAGLSGRVLYLDLDTVIVGRLDALRGYTGRFATLSTRGFDAEEGFVDGYNTSAMLWDASEAGGADAARAGSLRSLHDALRPEVFTCLMRWDHWVEMVAPGAHLLQDLFPGVFVDFRTHCRELGPPASAAVVCFPRYPKPHEASAEWIDAHWI